jgi:hypothetical protein
MENLLKSCSWAAQKIVRIRWRKQDDLLVKVTSFAVQQLVTAQTVGVLQSNILRLERDSANVTSQNTLLNIKYNETSTLVNKMQIKLKWTEKLKQENEVI